MKRSSDQYQFINDRWYDSYNDIFDDQPLDYNEGGWPEVLLDICGCWKPEEIVEAMRDYLQRVSDRRDDDGATRSLRFDTPHELADYLLATMADGLGFTEHGGSVAGAWLNPEGRRWLELAIRERDGE